MPEPRYFGIALTKDELHDVLGLPHDVIIQSVGGDGKGRTLITCLGVGSYDGVPARTELKTEAFFRPDIQTRTVSQVVIHQLKDSP